MDTKLLGGILLITGTCIGGGMLGLPIATAQGGLIPSMFLFISCWMLMTFTALLTLEVTLAFPRDSNIISIARATLGKPAELICWTAYLLFLYALVSAYIAGGQDMLHGLFELFGIQLPISLCGLLFVCIFGSIVIAGIKHVDLFNRLMMTLKFITIVALVILISLNIHIDNYIPGNPRALIPAITVAITSFGFSIVVPSLRNYFEDDIKKLRIAILVGSLIPLICYLAWEMAIFGLIPLAGKFGLGELNTSPQPITGLLNAIIYYVPSQYIILLARTFTTICILTAFACVSLGLSDYLSDGFRLIKPNHNHSLTIILATFAPPLLIVLIYPRAFIMFLSIAGLCTIVLQALMPAMMAWQARYTENIITQYQVRGGKWSLVLAMIASILVIVLTSYVNI